MHAPRRSGLAVATLLAGAALACGSAGGDAPGEQAAAHDPPVPWEVHALPEPPAPDPARVALGRLLFYEPLLGADAETACATCHSEFWGMSDALPRSIGHGAGRLAGPGREGPNVVRRNAQVLWNLAYRDDFLWDGGAASLEEQALLPLFAPDELDRAPQDVVDDLAAIPEYVDLFAAAFPGSPALTVDHMATALADFQRTFVSRRSLYDGYVDGDAAALSPDMKAGMQRFADFGCHDCHVPPLFEGPGYFDRGIGDHDRVPDDGRFEVTGVFLDPGVKVVKTYNLEWDLSRPSTFILDAQGVIRYAYVGKKSSDRPSVDRIVEEVKKLAQE